MINKLYTATGASESQTGTVYNATPSTITNGDPYQTALFKLSEKFHPTTGHMHTGAAGDAPILDVVLDIAVTGNTPAFGHLIFIPGPGISINQSGQNITFGASGGGNTPPTTFNVVNNQTSPALD